MTLFNDLEKDIKSLADPAHAPNLARYFKTGPGDYGEGDKFLGIKMGPIRNMVKKYWQLDIADVLKLIKSEYHEKRMIGLLILVRKYEAKNSTSDERREIFQFYLDQLPYINNWDLVDLTASHIIGASLDEPGLVNKDRSFLYELARSDDIWKRRIAVISTFHFIRKGDFHDSLSLGEILLSDSHDLIHKATGWMLREIGNRDRKTEEVFLKKYCKVMPRTMLRYAIEKFPEDLRQSYMKNKG